MSVTYPAEAGNSPHALIVRIGAYRHLNATSSHGRVRSSLSVMQGSLGQIQYNYRVQSKVRGGLNNDARID